MLKIKDSVDLKELEKFGFKFYDKGKHSYYASICKPNIYVELDKIIRFNYGWWDCNFEHIDILYGLIKADLVEKVKE